VKTQEQADALESLKLARQALIPAIRNRHHLMTVKPYGSSMLPSDGYMQVWRIESLIDGLIEALEKE
jgi:hypothetical protein